MRFVLMVSLLFTSWLCAQNTDSYTIELNYLKGNILPHKKGLDHLITGHPEGVFLGLLKQSDSLYEWQKAYNYPENGAYFLYQDLKNELLGETYAIGIQSNYYFFKRNLQFKVATGIAMVTNPYDKVTNSKNNAFGSKFMVNVDVGFSHKMYFDKHKWAVQTGLFLSHFSNGRMHSPNSGINTISVNLGVVYHINGTNHLTLLTTSCVDEKFSEPIHYNFVLRSGVNESSVINSGQHSFYHLGFFADKRMNRKSGLQLGAELFLSNFYKDFIEYQSVAYPNKNINPATDYKRIGLFVGHELYFDKMSIELQVGYYVYQPFKFDFPIYDRLGLKYYLNKKINGGVSVKTHGFLAEALEFSIGYRM